MLTSASVRTGGGRVAIAALAAGLVVAAPAMGAGKDPKKAPARGTATVAVVTPTGASGLQSRLVANGAEVGAKLVNGAGGVSGTRLKLVRVPARAGTSAAAIVAAARKARARALVLPCNDDRQTDIARASSRAGILTLAPCDHLSLAEMPRLSWAVGPSAAGQIAQLIGYARSQGVQTVFLVRPRRSSAYHAEMARLIEATVRRAKMRIVGRAAVRTDGKDVAAAERAIDKVGPDVVMSTVPAPYASRIVTTLRRQGERRPIYATDMMDAPPFRYPYTTQDVVFVSYGFARPSATQFRRTYRRMFGAPVEGSFPGLGYETVRLLAKGIALAHSAAPEKVDAAMAKGFVIPGVALGDGTYPGNGVREPIRNVGIAGIIRGGYQPLLASGPDRSLIAQ